jgi:SAM-dependent methyltransferase
MQPLPDIDDPSVTSARAVQIRSNQVLASIYREWYELLLEAVGPATEQGRVLELGSGGGFLKDIEPRIITSDVMNLEGVDLQVDAVDLPFQDHSLDAIVMTNVLHHIPNVRRFFDEASRVLRSGGLIAMIEPWRSVTSRPVYRWIHHEPWRPNAPTWEFETSGPLSGSNQALPWILFVRDRGQMETEYPNISLLKVSPIMPVSYLASGGLTKPGLISEATFRRVRTLEKRLDRFGMFALIVLSVNA